MESKSETIRERATTKAKNVAALINQFIEMAEEQDAITRKKINLANIENDCGDIYKNI